MSAPACTLLGVLLILGATAAARGDAILISDFKWADANAYQFDQNDNPVGNPQYNHDDDTGGLDFLGSVSANYNDLGFVAAVSCNWNHLYTPSNPGLGNAFSAAYMSGSAVSEANSSGQWKDFNDTIGSSVISFSVASDTAWALAADIMATTSGVGQAFYGYTLFDDMNNSYASAFVPASGGETINDSVNLGGVIPAGNYTFQLFIAAGNPFIFQQDSGSASIELTNGVFTIPEPASALLLVLGLAGIGRVRR